MSEQKPPSPGPRPGGGRRRSRRGGSGRSAGAPNPAAGNQEPRPAQPSRQGSPAGPPGQPGGTGVSGGGGRSRRRGRGGSGNRGGGAQPGQQPQPPPRDAELNDQTALARLRESGVELEKVHELEAFIYFPNEANARRVLPALQESGYTTYPEPTGDGRWVVEAVIRAAPLPEYIAAMRRTLRGLAGPLGGMYDGWSAIAIDEEAEAEPARLAELEPAVESLAEAIEPASEVVGEPATEPTTAEPPEPAEPAEPVGEEIAGLPAESDAGLEGGIQAEKPPTTSSPEPDRV